MLNISIVLYHPDWEHNVQPLVRELQRAKCVHRIALIDNSEASSEPQFESQNFQVSPQVSYLFTGANLGYGRAHNIALRETISEHTDYHLVLNDAILMNKVAVYDITEEVIKGLNKRYKK